MRHINVYSLSIHLWTLFQAWLSSPVKSVWQLIYFSDEQKPMFYTGGINPDAKILQLLNEWMKEGRMTLFQSCKKRKCKKVINHEWTNQQKQKNKWKDFNHSRISRTNINLTHLKGCRSYTVGWIIYSFLHSYTFLYIPIVCLVAIIYFVYIDIYSLFLIQLADVKYEQMN